MNAQALLRKTQAVNRQIGRDRIRQQLRPTDSHGAARTGYDASSGRYTVTSAAGSLQTVASLTTAAIPAGRSVGVSSGAVDAVPG